MKFNNKITEDFMMYSTAVIKSRAIPNADDNLKPIHRRILYAMNELKLKSSGKTIKSAKVVGGVMGSYHPHGDASIYDALVRLSQPWKVRYPLVVMQGNNGSISGDPAAASRYTEAKLSPIGEALLNGVDPDIVKYVPNYDDSTREPTSLPGLFPNIFCNGNEGIAVGMSCSILPHNLGEVVDALIAYIDNKNLKAEDFIKLLKGPDFPMGGIITEKSKIAEVYLSGRGTLNTRARYSYNEKERSFTFSEFPYLVDVETKIIAAIKKLVNDGCDAIEDYENHIGKDSAYIKVFLNKKANPDKVLKVLMAKTPLSKRVKVNNTLIVNGVPVEMGMFDMAKHYVLTQHTILKNKAWKEKAKQDKIAHINSGLHFAVLSIDEVIKIVRGSDTAEIARQGLIKLLGIDAEQADAILKLQLGRLTRLDVDDIKIKIAKAKEESAYQSTILENYGVRDGLLKEGLLALKKKFGDARRTELIDEEVKAEEDDKVEGIMVFLQDGGQVLVDEEELPALFKKGGALQKSTPIAAHYVKDNPVKVDREGKIVDAYGDLLFLYDSSADFVITVSDKGTVKKTRTADYGSLRVNGKTCKLRKGEELVAIFSANAGDSLFFVHPEGKLSRKSINDFNESSKLTVGVKGTSNPVVSAFSASGEYIFCANAEGQLKKVKVDEFGSMAVLAGNPRFVGAVKEHNFFWDTGNIYRVNWDDVKEYGRTAAGARLNNKAVRWIT